MRWLLKVGTTVAVLVLWLCEFWFLLVLLLLLLPLLLLLLSLVPLVSLVPLLMSLALALRVGLQRTTTTHQQ